MIAIIHDCDPVIEIESVAVYFHNFLRILHVCFCLDFPVGYTTSDLVFMWQSDPVQMDEIALPQFDIKQEDIKYGNCTKYYKGTGE